MKHTREMVEKQICQLMAEGFEIPAAKLVPNARLYEDLSLDSLDAVDMLVHLEENLNIKVEGERFMNVRTLSDVFEIVWSVINEASNTDHAALLATKQPELS